jgi:hypothetical protein
VALLPTAERHGKTAPQCGFSQPYSFLHFNFHQDPETTVVLQIVKMESSNKDVGPPRLKLEYYEGCLDTEGRTKTRGGRLK